MPNTPGSGIAISDEDIKEQTSAFSDVGERVGSVPDCIRTQIIDLRDLRRYNRLSGFTETL